MADGQQVAPGPADVGEAEGIQSEAGGLHVRGFGAAGLGCGGRESGGKDAATCAAAALVPYGAAEGPDGPVPSARQISGWW
ncbi:hypothetical protein GCM10010211_68090 [Streptomyces albospinus]|uniref:Uncharacterized protein n=1 Tax=Streptomyces albospinus TaxID=285515 RepID=A0ABQ2VKL1_9ACTN|nr:hypothetical protein GCM10010211_68090 [Streptomyces albospinus]